MEWRPNIELAKTAKIMVLQLSRGQCPARHKKDAPGRRLSGLYQSRQPHSDKPTLASVYDAIKVDVTSSFAFSPLSREMHANPISHRVYIIYLYASTAVLFATACEGWVLGKRLRKAITKVQKAARQKPNSKGSEKGRILKNLGE